MISAQAIAFRQRAAVADSHMQSHTIVVVVVVSCTLFASCIATTDALELINKHNFSALSLEIKVLAAQLLAYHQR